jgi:hypothetical protein
MSRSSHCNDSDGKGEIKVSPSSSSFDVKLLSSSAIGRKPCSSTVFRADVSWFEVDLDGLNEDESDESEPAGTVGIRESLRTEFALHLLIQDDVLSSGNCKRGRRGLSP